MSRNCQEFVIAMTVFRGGIRDGIGIDQTIRLDNDGPIVLPMNPHDSGRRDLPKFRILVSRCT